MCLIGSNILTCASVGQKFTLSVPCMRSEPTCGKIQGISSNGRFMLNYKSNVAMVAQEESIFQNMEMLHFHHNQGMKAKLSHLESVQCFKTVCTKEL